MSRPHDPHRASFPLGNPFRRMLPKGSYLSPKLLALLNKYEESLAGRLRELKPKSKDDVCSFSWMISAMGLLSDTHKDIKSLITELELPVNDWDDKWIDVYLDNSVKFLDICIAFSSEISRLSQGKLLLQCVLRNMERKNSSELSKAKSSIDSWRQHIGGKNPRVENCFPIIEKLVESLELPKVKNSAKGKVLMQALYGVRVETLFICSVFLSAFTGSDKLIDLQVAGTHLWAEAFNDLQIFVNNEIRCLISSGVSVLKEVQEVDTSVKALYPMTQAGAGPVLTDTLQSSITDLGNRVDKLSTRLDLLAKEVDGFFQVLMNGRDALLGNLRGSSSVLDSPKRHKMEAQIVNSSGHAKFMCTYKGA